MKLGDVIAGTARWAIELGEAYALLRSLPAASVDAVITDPPYSSGGAFRGDRANNQTTEKYVSNGTQIERPDFLGDNRDQRGFMSWCTLWLAECLRVAKPGAPICVFTDWRQLPTVTDAIQSGGWVWRGIAPWDKTEGTRPQKGRFRAQCEYIVWGTNGPSDHEADELVGVLPGCFRYVVRQDDKFHIAGKPRVLLADVVRICRPGGIVLDPFAGSGTTIVAALATGRRGIGFELSDGYADIARKRCEAEAAGTDWRAPEQRSLFGEGEVLREEPGK